MDWFVCRERNRVWLTLFRYLYNNILCTCVTNTQHSSNIRKIEGNVSYSAISNLSHAFFYENLFIAFIVRDIIIVQIRLCTQCEKVSATRLTNWKQQTSFSELLNVVYMHRCHLNEIILLCFRL